MVVTDVSITRAEVIMRVRFSKRQSPLPTTVLLRTTLTRTIKLHYYMLPPGSNHLLYCPYCLFCFCCYFCRLLSSVTLAILFLNTADIPLIKFVTSPPPLRIGQSVSLNCVANKSMAPVKVAWYREQKVLESGISEVVVIRNITSEDFGEYTCIAENHKGEDRKSVYLRGRMKTYKLFGYFSLLNKIFP